MNGFQRRIQYEGLSRYIPDNVKSFSSLNVDDTFNLQEFFSSIEDIIKVDIKSKIINNRVVKTPKGKSMDGKILTGWKLLSECCFDLRIDYTIQQLGSSICTTKHRIPFTCGVFLDEHFTLNSRYIPSIFVEDVYCELINDKSILFNINFIFTSEIC